MPPAIVAANYTPLTASGEAQLPVAALALLRVDGEKKRNKEILWLKQTLCWHGRSSHQRCHSWQAISADLHSSWSIASGCKTANTKIAGGSDMQSVFLLADDTAQAWILRNPKAGRGSKLTGRGGGCSSQRGDQRQPSSPVDFVSKQSSTGATQETRICRGRLV